MKNCLECLAADVEDGAPTCPFCGGGSFPEVEESKAETKKSKAETKKRGDG